LNFKAVAQRQRRDVVAALAPGMSLLPQMLTSHLIHH
jgi:hypothetical protein